MNTSITGLIGLAVAALALAGCAVLYSRNTALGTELVAMEAGRAALQHDAKAATERANVAERSIEEAKAEVANVRKEGETLKHSITQLRDQLEQVQIQAKMAREDFEAKLKSNTDELTKARDAAARAADELNQARGERDAAGKAANDAAARAADELARTRSERDAAQKAAEAAVADLQKERGARQAAERAAQEASKAPSPGASNAVPAPSP